MTLESVKDLGDRELNGAIHAAIGPNPFVGLMKRGYWWRPDSKGYTGITSEAGRYTREEAQRIAHSEVTIHEFPTPDYVTDLNPLHQIEITRFKTIEQNHMYCEKLTTVCRGTDYHPFSAPARLRAEAILLTLGGGHEH